MQTEAQRSIRITGKPDPELGICTFNISEPLVEGSVHCRSLDEAKGSPLLEKLLAMDSIAQVLVQGSKLTVQKKNNEDWQALGSQVAKLVRESLWSDETPIKKPEQPTRSSAQHHQHAGAVGEGINTPEAVAIQKLLDEEINPSLASHGGHVRLVDIKNQLAVLEFSGGCQGCSQATQTIKQGIEVAIQKKIPGIKGVVDATDHALGENPYYT